jgi:hypothetical protein
VTTPAASKKDKHGNRTYAIPHPETRELLDLPSWSRLKGLMHSGGLETWKLKKVAAAVAKSTALQMEAANPETCYKAVEKALEADTEAADVGTYVHRYTEQIDAGELEWDFVPPAAVGFVKAYEKLRAEWAWEVVEAEVTIYNLVIGYAGSADRFMRIPGLAEQLDLPAPALDVYALDIKTGKVHDEVALQLGAYANGEGIFEAPSKMDLGFAVREAQLEDDIRAGVGFDRINPNRRKWSDEAIREAKAALEAEWWEAYRHAGKFRPMPKGLRRDVGVVVHLYADPTDDDPVRATAELIPVRLDGRPLDGVVPSTHVIDGLAALYKWGRRKDIVGEPIARQEGAQPVSEPTPEPAPEPAPVETCPSCGELSDFHAAGCPAVVSQAVDTLDRAGLLEGAEVGETEDDLAATDEDKRPYIDWLGDIARNRKHLLPALRQALDAEGLTKKLRQDTWTIGELRRWSNCAIAVERAHL